MAESTKTASVPRLQIDLQFSVLHAHPNLPERADHCGLVQAFAAGLL
jgi:hypothetical protein